MKHNPYSISKMGTFKTCSKMFKLKYIDKVKIESEPQLALYRGSYAHEILENKFDYNIPVELNHIFTQEEADKVIEMVKEFRETELGQKTEKLINRADSILEEDFAFDKKLKFVDFWDKSAWMRGSADAFNVNLKQSILIDYKTGQDKSETEDFGYEQGMLYAVYMFIKYPDIQSVKSVFVFIEHGTKKEIFYTRSEFNSYIKHFYDKTKKIEKTEIFKDEISALCSFCDYNNTEHCTSFMENEMRTESLMDSKISLDF